MPLLLQCKPMPEEWRPVVGYEGLYEVSSLGQVRSLDRMVKHSKAKKRFCKGKLLKACLGVRGYFVVVLNKQGKAIQFPVHRLVAVTFLGQSPENCVVCHGSKGKLCNELTNLSWGTYEQNNGPDKVRDGTDNRGEKCGSAKLNSMQVNVIRHLLESKSMTQKEIAAIFGVRPQQISRINTGKRWQH